MTSPPRLPDQLRHTQEAAQVTLRYVAGMDKAAFLKGSRTQQAVFFNFFILGEAAARLMASYAEFLQPLREAGPGNGQLLDCHDR